ncbi:tail fiber assembly protein [Citrobacter freundii]
MLMKNFKPEVKVIGSVPVIFYTDEDGNDWYESQKLFLASTLKLTYDDKGNVVSSSWDVSMLAPDNLSVAEVKKTAVPDDFFEAGKRWVFDGKKIKAFQYSQEELKQQAEEQKNSLLEAAKSKIIVPQTKLALGRPLTEAQQAELIDWLDYIDELEACDPMVDGFVWPEVPDVA